MVSKRGYWDWEAELNLKLNPLGLCEGRLRLQYHSHFFCDDFAVHVQVPERRRKRSMSDHWSTTDCQVVRVLVS